MLLSRVFVEIAVSAFKNRWSSSWVFHHSVTSECVILNCDFHPKTHFYVSVLVYNIPCYWRLLSENFPARSLPKWGSVVVNDYVITSYSGDARIQSRSRRSIVSGCSWFYSISPSICTKIYHWRHVPDSLKFWFTVFSISVTKSLNKSTTHIKMPIFNCNMENAFVTVKTVADNIIGR